MAESPQTKPGNGVWPDDPAAATGPLRGVRVLDLTTVVMGPSATQLLGDFGADVVKVEPEGGDIMRWSGPWRHAGMGPLFLQLNRNKRGVVLDLKTQAGKAAALGLAGRADVLVSNVRPQGMQRLGLDYDGVRGVNERIIYCAAVGYGSGGPYAGLGAYDDLMQAASGLAGLFGALDGVPRYVPLNVCDRTVGLYVASSVMAALYHRAMTGEGQFIEVPMFETMVQFVLGDHLGGHAFAPPEGEMGYRRLMSRTRKPYPTKDGYVAVLVYTDRHWQAFSQFVGHPELMQENARFRTPESRIRHAEEVGGFVASQLTERGTAEWLAIFAELDIPACPVNTIEALASDPHLRSVGFFEEMEHPTEGRLTVTRPPVHFSRSPSSVRRLAPNLGEHDADVLGD